MNSYFDTHCHLNGSFYKTPAADDIQRARTLGVQKIVVPGTEKDDSHRSLALAARYPGVIHAAVGVHPASAHGPHAWSFLDKIRN